jgi:hypothetical protein
MGKCADKQFRSFKAWHLHLLAASRTVQVDGPPTLSASSSSLAPILDSHCKTTMRHFWYSAAYKAWAAAAWWQWVAE